MNGPPAAYGRSPIGILLALFLSVGLFLLFGLTWWIDRTVRPVLVAWAKEQAITFATQSIADGVHQALTGVNTPDLIVPIPGGDPANPLGLVYRWNELNRLQAEAVRAVIHNLEARKFQSVPLPLGELTGLGVLAGAGPRVHVVIAAVGSVQADTRFDFQGAGVNQVLHNVYLDVKVHMRVLAPLVSTEFPVEQKVQLVSVLLRGEVPAVYLNWSGDSTELQRLLGSSPLNR